MRRGGSTRPWSPSCCVRSVSVVGVTDRTDERTGGHEEPAVRTCDLSVTCFVCGGEMRPEHAHYRCPACGWRDSCCDGPY
jgi:hypothetical protein